MGYDDVNSDPIKPIVLWYIYYWQEIAILVGGDFFDLVHLS
jgi:hypothetical protein